jgi:transcriptional regulator GlxA family with amidase domain
MSDNGIYREAGVDPSLSDYVVCTWYSRIGSVEPARPVRIVPDGCMDLVWIGGELIVAGPDTVASEVSLSAGAEVTGLRFQPGVAPRVLGIAASELLNTRCPATDVTGAWAKDAASRLEGVDSIAATTEVLAEVVRQRLEDVAAADPIVGQLVRTIRAAPDDRSERVATVATRLGLSERQVHRRCVAALGYGPKAFAGIVRFQRFLARGLRPGRRSLAEIALDIGYADQAHLTREVRRLAGLPPAALIAELDS